MSDQIVVGLVPPHQNAAEIADAIKRMPFVRSYVEDRTALLVRPAHDRHRQWAKAGDLFEPGPYGIALLEVRRRQAPHPDALVRRGLDQPQRLQLAQRLPYRRLADLKLHRDPALHEAACAKVRLCAEELGFTTQIMDSPLTGAEGNKEFLLYARRGGTGEKGKQ